MWKIVDCDFQNHTNSILDDLLFGFFFLQMPPTPQCKRGSSRSRDRRFGWGNCGKDLARFVGWQCTRKPCCCSLRLQLRWRDSGSVCWARHGTFGRSQGKGDCRGRTRVRNCNGRCDNLQLGGCHGRESRCMFLTACRWSGYS